MYEGGDQAAGVAISPRVQQNLGVRTADLEMKEALLRSDPLALFTIPHFDGYPAVLVQLDKISANNLKRLILEAWLARAPERSVCEYLAGRKRA